MFYPNKFRQAKTAIAAFSLLTATLNLGELPGYSVAAFPLNSPPGITNDQGICSTDLTGQIDQLLSRSEIAIAHWGVIIQNEQTQEILYQRNADQLFIPASNMKLLTTAAALLSLGENYQIKTPFYGQGHAPMLQQLTLIAQGDPTLTREKLRAIAVQLKNQGIQQIEKLVLVDDLTPEKWINGTWEWEDIHYDYAAPINRAILDKNTVNLTLKATQLDRPAEVIWSNELGAKQWQVINQTKVVSGEAKQPIQIRGRLTENKLIITGELPLGSEESNDMAIPNPSLYFLENLAQVLTEEGIQVTDQEIINSSPFLREAKTTNSPSFLKETQTTNSPPFLRETQTTNSPPFLRGAGGDQFFLSGVEGDKILGEIVSLPLSEIIKITNQDSNNLYAEALLNILKNQQNPNIEPVRVTLKSLGINPDLLILKDGSGLSRQNLVSPRSFNQLLLTLSPNQTYRNSLAIAGQTGTLKNRFLNTPLVGKLQAKTGTLLGVSGLSGYLTNSRDQPFVFSILVNNANLPSSMLRETTDQILLLTHQVQSCSSP